MDAQLLIPSPQTDFIFDSTSTSPFTTAPSSPKFFYNTPTISQPLHHHNNHHYFEQTDFAFDFSGQLDRPSISDADDLFDGGKIKPLEPPPPPSSSSSSSSTRLLAPIFSEAFRRTPKAQIKNRSPRGRETTVTTTAHRSSRSLSPLRASDQSINQNVSVSTTQSSQFGFTWYNKWNLKNLLLFRSTSEGSAATINDQSNNLDSAITRDVKITSFRSCDGGGSVGKCSRKMKRKVSAHEIHYTANRAVAEEMRRKTFLPYKSGLLGCLGFSQTVHESFRGR
ncbi:hypothetical protein QVD17_14512 [Tagetes erecta]|uniref:Uncharacterized protein n=1 Tax=Tagetes erecta TaxID=13708 RepID=A0AAD8L1A6_TARER|nr:hypothetical protein QVD17_14512 [Tagetes erecta]